MASLNKVQIIGNLGRDPEVRTMPSGGQLANVTIATTDRWKDKNTGENKEATEWHRVVFNGRLAEVVGQYLRKGSQVYVEGSLRTRSWEKDGVKQYSTEIRADTMQMLGSRQDGGGRGDQGGYDDGGQQQGRQQPQQNQQRQAPQGGQQQGQRGQQQDQQRGGYSDQQDRGQGGQGQQRQQPQGGYGDSRGAPQRAASGFGDMDDSIPF